MRPRSTWTRGPEPSPGPRGEGPRPHRSPAARVHGRPNPGRRSGDVLVRVEAVAICGSDVHGYTGTTGRRIPPVIMGHEAAGVVEARGRARKRGSRARASRSTRSSGAAIAGRARRGRTNLCEIRQTFGVSTPAFRRDGAMAEYVFVPAAPPPPPSRRRCRRGRCHGRTRRGRDARRADQRDRAGRPGGRGGCRSDRQPRHAGSADAGRRDRRHRGHRAGAPRDCPAAGRRPR